jgi:hypothetical protein
VGEIVEGKVSITLAALKGSMTGSGTSVPPPERRSLVLTRTSKGRLMLAKRPESRFLMAG